MNTNRKSTGNTKWKMYCFILVLLMLYSSFAWEQHALAARRVLANSKEARVLYISSYSYSWTSVPEQIAGIKSVLADKAIINYEFMDTKNTDYDKKYSQFYSILKYKMESRAPYDAILTGDDAALDFTMMYRNSLFKNTPVVFMGIDDYDRAREAEKISLFTGSLERANYKISFDMAKKMKPEAKRFVFILDNSLNGIGIGKDVNKNKDLLKGYEISFINSSLYNKSELCSRLSLLNDNDIVFLFSMGKKKGGGVYTEEERAKILNSYANVPLFRVSNSGIEEGLVGGYVVNHRKIGKNAAKTVWKIINGANPQSMSLDTNTPCRYYFNQRALTKYHLTIPSEIDNPVILYRKKTFFDIHKRMMFISMTSAIFLLIFLLMVVAFISGRRQKQWNTVLHKANEELKMANSAKSNFLSRITHDMRTPLNGILGLIELMKKEKLPGQACKDLEQMEMSGNYLLNLINDTLDVSKIESGQMELHPVVCEGKELFNNVLKLIKPNLEAKKIELQLHADNIPFTMLYIDFGRLEQVFMNVLSNAIKFSEEGSFIEVYVENLSNEKGVIVDEVHIVDHGVGIDEEFLPHIFEPFSQEYSDKTSQYKGTGLGMAITKQIIEMMGGKISIKSEKNKGTDVFFTMVLPVATQEQLEEQANEKTILDSHRELEGTRVLLCEDNVVNAQIATRLLANAKVRVDWAQNGEIGLNMLEESTAFYYDAILMDIRMPIMDGLETAGRIRKLDREDAADIPIIAMTANAFDDDMKEAMHVGMNGYLAKPVDNKQMLQLLWEQTREFHIVQKRK